MTSLRLDPDIEKRLSMLAAQTGRTKTYYIRQLLEEHLDELEDLYLAENRLERPAKSYSSAEVRRELGLDD